MSIRFQCPKCGNRLSAGDGYAGNMVFLIVFGSRVNSAIGSPCTRMK